MVLPSLLVYVSYGGSNKSPATHWVRPFQFSPPLFREVAEAALTVRIERAQLHRARSASKKGTWPLPPLLADFFSCLARGFS